MNLRWIIHNKLLHRDEWKTGEPEVVRLEKSLHGKLAVDIGSNRGYHTRVLRKQFKKVVTVDPNPKWNADLQIALSNYNGDAMFRIGNDEGGADSLVENPSIHGKRYGNLPGYRVRVKTYDMLGLDADLVKIDVEGAELEVLEGIKAYPPRNLIVEIHDNSHAEQIFDLMTEKGYQRKPVDLTHWWFYR